MIVNKHTVCDDSLFTHGYYRRKDCIKNFYKYLKEHIMEIITVETLKMLPLTEKEIKSYYK